MNEIYEKYKELSSNARSHDEVADRMVREYAYTWQEIAEARIIIESNEPNYWLYKKHGLNDATPAQWDAIRPEADPLSYQVGGDHYTKKKIQPVEYIHANEMDYMDGAIVKYISRWRDKGGVKDLRKIKQFVDLIIKMNKL